MKIVRKQYIGISRLQTAEMIILTRPFIVCLSPLVIYDLNRVLIQGCRCQMNGFVEFVCSTFLISDLSTVGTSLRLQHTRPNNSGKTTLPEKLAKDLLFLGGGHLCQCSVDVSLSPGGVFP